jgi:ectoine hydroxylase-related dioxygenase (phytanoyl-CoA dioxygenase family)
MQVTDEQLDAFRRDGWVLLRDVVAPEAVDRVRALLESHRREHEHEAAPTGKGGGKDGYGDPNSDVSRDYFLSVPGVAEWHREVGLYDAAQALLGVDDATVVRDRLFLKAPGVGERTMWHQDGPFTQEATGDLVVLWIPLAIDGEAGAPLRLASGSHRGPAMLESGLSWWLDVIGPEFEVVEEGDVERRYKVETAVASVGDIVALHGRVVHASEPNRSSSERVAYSVRFSA